MVARTIEWLKANKLLIFLVGVIAYLVIFKSDSRTYTANKLAPISGVAELAMDEAMGTSANYGTGGRGFAPQMDVEERKFVTDSQMSLLVKDVRTALDQIQTTTEAKKGYVVNTNIRTPEGLSTGNITIRVPADQLRPMLSYLRALGVKVVSENIFGHDVTDQYVDVQARLDTLTKTKVIFENMLPKATDVDEILRVQQRILDVQRQIDNLKGQLKYMDATASSSLITVNLATDELALPYTPDQPWRPSVVFKYATRSLVKNVRNIGSAGIWLGVYSVLWVPALVGIIAIKKYRNRKARKA